MKKIEPLNLTISSSPHAHSSNSTAVIMRDVCIALVPALIAAIVLFGWRVLTLTAFSVAGCVFFEWGYRRMMKKDCTVGDWSAVVTGVLIAFVCPANVPYWMILIGDFFAIVVVKQLFGGIGMNIVNPALAARALMMFSWTSAMTSGAYHEVKLLDAVSSATPMEALAAGSLPNCSVLELFLGRCGGSLGEVSAAALLVGGAYLLIRKVISWRIPTAYLASVAVLTMLFPRGGNDFFDWMLCQLLSGGLLLGAIFMATDYTTSPVTHFGQLAYGVGCGVLTVLFRYFGAMPEGVTFAILIMNCCVGFFDKMGIPARFGAVKQKKQKKQKKQRGGETE